MREHLGRFLVGLVVLGLCLAGADCRQRAVPKMPQRSGDVDQSNLPPWEGGWSIIGRVSAVPRFVQTFTPRTFTLTAVEIDVMIGNRGRGGDVLTVRIMEEGRVLGTAVRQIAEGFDGLVRFEFQPTISVTPGEPLQLRVEDTNKDVFGWRYGLNTYPGGMAHFDGAPWNGGAFDFRFRTYGY